MRRRRQAFTDSASSTTDVYDQNHTSSSSSICPCGYGQAFRVSTSTSTSTYEASIEAILAGQTSVDDITDDDFYGAVPAPVVPPYSVPHPEILTSEVEKVEANEKGVKKEKAVDKKESVEKKNVATKEEAVEKEKVADKKKVAEKQKLPEKKKLGVKKEFVYSRHQLPSLEKSDLDISTEDKAAPKDFVEDLKKEIQLEKRFRTVNDPRCTLVVVGTKNGGKTTLINCMSKRDQFVEPTIGIDFSCVTTTPDMTVGVESQKSETAMCHIWEIGGDPSLNNAELSSVPFIACPCVARASISLVIDLTRPDLIWETVHGCIESLRIVIEKKLNEMEPDVRAKADETMQQRWEKISQAARHGHGGGRRAIAIDIDTTTRRSDKGSIEPLSIPLAIVATKYDLFEEFDADTKNRIMYVLRLLALYYGASLIFFSSKNSRLRSALTRIFDLYAFGRSERQGGQSQSQSQSRGEGEREGDGHEPQPASAPSPSPLAQILYGSDSFSALDPTLVGRDMTRRRVQKLVEGKLRGIGHGIQGVTQGQGSGDVDMNAVLKNRKYKEYDIDVIYNLEKAELSKL